MRFSDRFNISRGEADDWFDPALHLDTPLFLDPFLVYASEDGEFDGSHAGIIQFFDCVFQLVAEAGPDENSTPYKRALHCVRFPEVEELCLGYSAAGTRGSGSGGSIAREIAAAVREAIQAGIRDIRHFEKIAILRANIGPDRVSDITAALLRPRLVKYTEAICARHAVPSVPCRFIRGGFDLQAMRWQLLNANLPLNPYNGKPVLLVPAAFLRELPTINADGFLDFCKDDTAAALRAELNVDISAKVRKKDIIDLARRHPSLLEAYVTQVEDAPPCPYDCDRDPRGFVNWYGPTKAFCDTNPIAADVVGAAGIGRLIDGAVERFKSFVEDHEGWRGLWNPGREPKDERAAQMLLLGIVTRYCDAAGVSVQPAQNIGKAPVTFSKGGESVRILLELKLARNRRHWNIVEREHPSHDKAERAERGVVIIVMLDFDDMERATACSKLVSALKPAYNLRSVTVDAGHEEETVWRPKPGAAAGDTFNIAGSVVGSAVGGGASLEARDITLAPAISDGGTYEI